MLGNLNVRYFEVHKAPFNEKSKIFDSSKVDAHTAIIPTYVIPKIESLTKDQLELYNEVAKRFYSHFMPKATYKNKTIEFLLGDETFLVKGKVLHDPGWMKLYDIDNNENSDLPQIEEHSTIDRHSLRFVPKETTPPKRYNTETLIRAMKFCGENIDIEHLTEYDDHITKMILEGYSLGTPATWDATIEKILGCNYVKMKGKSFISTEEGRKLVENFPIKNILDPAFTGRIEKTLKGIEKGEVDPEAFITKIKNMTIQGTQHILNASAEQINAKAVICKCPVCESPIFEFPNSYGCSNKECGKRLSKDNKLLDSLGLKMSKKFATDILTHKKLQINGIESKKKPGSTYDAIFILQEQEGSPFFNINMNFDTEYETVGACPECKNDVLEYNTYFGCSNKGCRFKKYKEDKWFAFSKKKLTRSMMKSFLKDGQAKVTGMWSEKYSKKYSSVVVMEKNEKGYYNFMFEKKAK